MFKLIDINSIIDESIKMMRSMLSANITIIHNGDENCGYVYGNPTQLNQIFINLYTNAYHAMRENGGTIEVKLRKVRCREISCLNDKRFDKDMSVGEGTGLGLSVVQGTVVNHKDEITVESKKMLVIYLLFTYLALNLQIKKNWIEKSYRKEK
ncbi:hypothetical protein SAMN05446037_104425 [Anaerovirgula multivorans]|uniref:histidine kinase n=1 Tax=Anaerovirgula multivorans TaxID=312168 RepID=A0A239K896_9FIRM|nr:ATP-binding protein [Anaerovirgula multivorans]SNT14325.1 hypothetical protein SAMN05446037_104425 [Anaerovirgula multivorans]